MILVVFDAAVFESAEAMLEALHRPREVDFSASLSAKCYFVTFLWLGIVSKLPLLSLCVMLKTLRFCEVVLFIRVFLCTFALFFVI